MLTSRRGLMKTGAAVAGAVAAGLSARAGSPSAAAIGVPLLHVTDLFHPHGDPDDHFDLAVAYALARRGSFDLRGVVIDYPPEFRAGDPAVAAVAQMNRLTGLAVPVAIGTSLKLKSRQDALPNAPASETAAVRFIHAQLRAAERPAALVCVGNAADVAVAALRDPELFKTKCAGVYLNSGSAHDNPSNPKQLEFNVRLDAAAYAAMFDLPCPLFWFPCWHTTEQRQSGPDGSFYWLPHREALAGLSAGLANYFAYLFDKSANPKWLRAMTTMPPEPLWQTILSGKRGMWSTASQFAAAALVVTKDGEIAPARDADDAAVFRRVPVQVSCADDGRTTWTRSEQETGRWMLSITDAARYPAAMTRAVSELFHALR
ncbi:MAG: nucleoside hydrolase [Kiritimatiellia bacterium]|nr:nucleoside hydrolase [Kiritimatiellia bacterium]MDD4174880.1 nucleoside hydrolase [Kiritimatiellia bacterium]MDD4443244.1 nucleoside hydrolase [Kiritimatiellia bacterium]